MMYINKWYSIAGKKEYEGLVKNANKYIKDYYYGEKTFEEAEEKMLKEVISNLVNCNNDYLIIGGNLSNQLSVLNKVLEKYEYSYLGLYSACATFVEGLIIACKFNQESIVLTSSHNLTAERQFRFPIEYGSLKKKYGNDTITAAVGCIVSNKKSKYKLGNYTIGEVVDSEIKDATNMGAVMAPSAASTIYKHLLKYNKTLDDYDLILTGDLGRLGLTLLNEILKSQYGIIKNSIVDAGSLVYPENDKYLGASGPSVLPYVLFNKIFDSKIKKLLIVGTGALHSPTLVNHQNTIPAIAHAIEIEVTYD